MYSGNRLLENQIFWQPSKLKAKNWVEMTDVAHRTCNTNSQIKFQDYNAEFKFLRLQ